MKKILLKTLFIGLVFTFFGCTEESIYNIVDDTDGKVNIYIEDNISTADAQAKLNAEIGTQTENIYIRNTTQVTELYVKLVGDIRDIYIESNSNLEKVTIEGTNSKMNLLYIHDGTGYVPGKLKTLTVKKITRAKNLDMRLGAYEDNKSVIFTDLEIIDAYLKLGFGGDVNGIGDNNGTIDFPHLKYINYIVKGDNLENSGFVGKLQKLNLPLLEECHNLYLSVRLENLNFPKLKKTNNFTIELLDNEGVQNINLPQLTNCISFRYVQYSTNNSTWGINPNINIPNLAYCKYFTLGNLALDETKINGFLHQFLNVQPISGKNIDFLSYNFVNAAPTGQGLIDKQTLITQGNTVITN